MEQQLKQRLVGAVVLVSLAVIFIPIILEGPRDELAPRRQRIPEPPPLEYRADSQLPLPENGDEAGDAATTGSPVPVPGETVPEDGGGAPPVPVTAVGKPKPAPPPAPKPPAPKPPPRQQSSPETLANGWYAQVGSFSQQANAARLQARLGKAGYRAHLQQTDTGKGSSYRVLVGPEKTRDLAETLLRKLAKDLKIEGIVIELSASAG